MGLRIGGIADSVVSGVAGGVKGSKTIQDAERKKKERAAAAAAKQAEDRAAGEKKLQEEYAALKPERIAGLTGEANGAQLISQEQRDILQRRQSAMAGYQAPELAAMRASMAGTQQASQAQADRALQASLARSGIKGGAAASLQAQMAQKAALGQAQSEQNLMLQQAQRQREALGEYEGSVGGAMQTAQGQQLAELSAGVAQQQALEAYRKGLQEEDLTRETLKAQTKMAEQEGKKGCVIATHAVQNGAFHIRELAEAKRWCEAALHDKWWGEAMRRGYRWLGRRAIARGQAPAHYAEFKRYVGFGNGKDRSLKAMATFAVRSVQMFIIGLFVRD